MNRGRFVAALLLASLAVVAVARDGDGGVPAKLLAHLTRGVNLTRWFCYVGNPDDTDHFAHYLQPEDFRTFSRLNLGFVRLCISPEVGFDAKEGFRASNQPYLDSAVRRLTGANLAVFYDLHDNGQLKLDQNGTNNGAFLQYWESVARHFKGQHEDLLVFELLNEPVYQKNPQDWYALQAKTVQAIRAIDSRRSIVVTGTGWGGIDTLAAMTPLEDKNLIYSYHCYDPFFFTHQGATWAGEQVKHFKQMPFPSSPEAVGKMLDQIEPAYQNDVKWYGEQRYDAAYLKLRLSVAEDWGRKNGVPVVLGEFGAFPPVSPPESRARWFEAMRSVQDELHVRSCLWGYDDAFGLARSVGPDGSLQLDPLVLKSFFGK